MKLQHTAMVFHGGFFWAVEPGLSVRRTTLAGGPVRSTAKADLPRLSVTSLWQAGRNLSGYS